MISKRLMRVTAVSLSLFLGIVLIEVGVRIARPVLPPIIQLMLRDVKKHPFTDETLLPPPAWWPVANYQMSVIPGLDHQLQYPNAAVSFHVSSKNWLDPNSHIGFRVDSIDWEPRWPVDIVTVGDSFTFCFTEYDDCWVKGLETEHGYSVVNLGQGATGAISHANILRTFGLPYEPDLVLWQWYGNDNNEDFGMIQGEVQAEAVDPPRLRNEWLVTHSVVFKLFDIFTNSAAYGNQSYASQTDTHFITIGGEQIYFGRSYTVQTADLEEEKNRQGQEAGFEALLTAKKILDEAGIQLVVFPVPTKEEVYRTQIEASTDFELLNIDKMEANRAALLEFCSLQGLNCFDPTDRLIARSQSAPPLYFSHDTHLNPAGNRLLLEIVQEEIDELLSDN